MTMKEHRPWSKGSQARGPRLLALLLISACCLATATVGGCKRTPPPTTRGPRIVALSPAIGLILRDLGRTGDVVGRHGYDDFLPREIPSCGDQAGIDYERLVGVNPTHVFTQWGERDYPARLKSLAKDRGWTLVDLPLKTLPDIRNGVKQIDASLGAPAAGTPAASALLQRMERAWAHHDGLDQVGRVLLLASVSPVAAFGPGSCHQQILTALGAAPACVSGAPFISMDVEDVVKLAPDAIVLILPRAPGSPAGTTPAIDLLGALARPQIPAVKAGRVALIDDPGGQLPGSSMVIFGEELARVLDAWAKQPPSK